MEPEIDEKSMKKRCQNRGRFQEGSKKGLEGFWGPFWIDFGSIWEGFGGPFWTFLGHETQDERHIDKPCFIQARPAAGIRASDVDKGK